VAEEPRLSVQEAYAELKRLVDDSTVLIRGGGSGFFVAPGKVLSCAHVVSTRRRAADRVNVCWQGHEMSGKVLAIPPDNADGGLWGYPDLALIDIDDPPPGPWVWLDETPPAHAAELYAVGYNTVYTSQPGMSRALVGYVGAQQFGTHDLWRVKGDELASGMSGGPVLDLAHGGVCGVIKTSRRTGSPDGGLVIPARAIVEHFPELTPAGPPGRWGELRAALRHVSATRELLDRDEERLLLAILTVVRPSLYALFRQVTGELRADPQEPLREGVDLVREVADSVLPVSGEQHPLVRLCDVLAAQSDGPGAERLHALASRVAARIGQEHRPGRGDEAAGTKRSSAVEIQLTSYAPNRQRHLLTIWTYHDSHRRPAQVFCSDRPLTLREIRARVRAVLPRTVAELYDADALTIEFTLPHRLLHEGVDEWDLGAREVPLGSRFPVIVRIGDRPPESGWHWRRRWESLHAYDRTHGTPLTWVDCHSQKVFHELYGGLQLNEGLAALAVTHLPGPEILKALLHAGIPVALWPRWNCTDHVDGVSCAGDRFHEDFTRQLAERPLRDLPVIVKTLRTKAVINDDDHGLTLLWDDPTRQRPDEFAALGVPRQGVQT
jgi:hypothetical protein